MTDSWYNSVLGINYLNLEGIDVTAPLIGMAKKARMIQGLTAGSVPILFPTGTNVETTTDIQALLQCGTKFWDAFLFMAIKKANKMQAYKGVFVTSAADQGEFDITSIPKVAISMILLWLTRGTLADVSSQSPLPKMVRMLNGIVDNAATTEGAFMKANMSFDPRLLNFSSIFDTPADSLGFDPVFVQRFKLSIAGHKPLKVVLDNWAIIEPNLKPEADTSTDGKISALVRLLHKMAAKGLTYKALHPASKDNLAQKYNGFYKTSLHAIVVVMSGYNVMNFDNSLTIVCSRGLFNKDPFMSSVGDHRPTLVSYQSTVAPWNLVNMENDFGDPWIA